LIKLTKFNFIKFTSFSKNKKNFYQDHSTFQEYVLFYHNKMIYYFLILKQFVYQLPLATKLKDALHHSFSLKILQTDQLRRHYISCSDTIVALIKGNIPEELPDPIDQIECDKPVILNCKGRDGVVVF